MTALLWAVVNARFVPQSRVVIMPRSMKTFNARGRVRPIEVPPNVNGSESTKEGEGEGETDLTFTLIAVRLYDKFV